MLLRDDPVLECSELQTTQLAATASLFVYCLGIPFAIYILCRILCTSDKHEDRRRVALLTASYQPGFWWMESAELIKKFFLTSVILKARCIHFDVPRQYPCFICMYLLTESLRLCAIVAQVAPDTVIQLWFGAVLMAASCIFYTRFNPFRDDICALVQIATQLQLFFTFMTAFIFFDCKRPYLSITKSVSCLGLCEKRAISTRAVECAADDDDGLSGFSETLGVTMVVINAAAFFVVLIYFSRQLSTSLKEMRRLRALLPNGDLLILHPPRAPSGGFHLFLSHVWTHAQDQCATIKAMLEVMAPGCKIFLDVDNLKSIADLERNVEGSDVVLIFLTTRYLQSYNCRRELVAAIQFNVPIVVVAETDENHGRVDLQMLREEAVRSVKVPANYSPRHLHSSLRLFAFRLTFFAHAYP